MTDDTISRQAAIDAFYHIKCNLQMMDDSQTADKMIHGLRLAENAIQQLPSAQKTGRWIIDETFGSFACSICGSWHAGGFDGWRSPFCPNCGAKMEVES